MRVTFDVSQVATMTVSLGRAGARVKPRASAALRKVAADIEADAKVLAPVGETGDLMNSISTTISANGMAAEIGPTVEYGIYQEYGTSTQPGTAFLGPAFDRRAPQLDDMLAEIGADI